MFFMLGIIPHPFCGLEVPEIERAQELSRLFCERALRQLRDPITHHPHGLEVAVGEGRAVDDETGSQHFMRAP